MPDESVDVLVTSPPYWGQRMSGGMGVEEDPREYVRRLVEILRVFKPKVKHDGIVWINIGDAYNTPVNWRPDDRDYSSLGPGKTGLDEDNSAYIKPRARRKAYLRKADAPWLTYGNLLALPYRMVIGMCDDGWLLRGEVIWRKKNPMPEGRCRRPHRSHESIYLFATSEKHAFLTDPPVKSVWEFSNERMAGPAHYSRFPLELPRRCVSALGRHGKDVVVLDPFSGSGTTGLAALSLGCSYVGFEIDPEQVAASNTRLAAAEDLPRLSRRVSPGSDASAWRRAQCGGLLASGSYYPGEVPYVHAREEPEGTLSRKTLILFVWLIVGAAAAGQRGDFTNVPSTCSSGATIAATIAIGPLNYLGVNPTIACNWPSPSGS
ncbi:MAG TPA: site-specific DNA-methyltransferase [Trebonia sp.]|nr:site-specific DNA-methyltransferase [Trebonia sp.]